MRSPGDGERGQGAGWFPRCRKGSQDEEPDREGDIHPHASRRLVRDGQPDVNTRGQHKQEGGVLGQAKLEDQPVGGGDIETDGAEREPPEGEAQGHRPEGKSTKRFGHERRAKDEESYWASSDVWTGGRPLIAGP